MNRTKSVAIIGRALAICICFMVTIGCSAASKAVKRGDEFQKANNYFSASQEYLTALGLEPDHKDAKTKLCQVAQQAYQQKLSIAENYDKAKEFESALPQYTDLSMLIEKLSSQNCLSFAAINARQKMADMKTGASEKYYAEAEQYFGVGNYSSAIRSYQSALNHNNPYKDSINKIAESYYQIASTLEKQKSYRDAAQNYLSANNTSSGYKDAAHRATSILYSLGDYFLKKNLCRNAYDDFSNANTVTPGFKDVAEKLNSAEACSVSKIAFVRFDNPTGKNLAGMSVGDYVFDEIKSRLPKQASKFIRTIDRDELHAILGEQQLGGMGVTDDYASFKQLKGVHYLIFGKLSQVNVIRPNPKEESVQTPGDYHYKCIETEKDGKQYETTCWKKVPVYFDRTSAKIDISLTGSIKVVSVATGEQVIFHSITAKASDSVQYADIKTDISDINIPAELGNLTKARRDLKDEDALAREIISEITGEMVSKIINKIDRKQTAQDPVEMYVRL